MNTLLLVNVASTWAMVGLIWFVQVVHYPLMNRVGEQQFAAYERLHQQRTSLVVIPLMLTELATTVALCWLRPTGPAGWLCWGAAALLAVVWLSTFLLQVPAHEQLSTGFSDAPHARLVATNWVRTVGWSLRGVLVLALLGVQWRG